MGRFWSKTQNNYSFEDPYIPPCIAEGEISRVLFRVKFPLDWYIVSHLRGEQKFAENPQNDHCCMPDFTLIGAA